MNTLMLMLLFLLLLADVFAAAALYWVKTLDTQCFENFTRFGRILEDLSTAEATMAQAVYALQKGHETTVVELDITREELRVMVDEVLQETLRGIEQ